MRAIVLAGGKGTRLRPYTIALPKPLMPLGDQPILEVVVKQLIYHGFDHITMAVNHQAELIKTFFGNGEKWGINIDYTLENEPLGTMGPLHLIGDLPDKFLVMNGDILTDLSFSDFYHFHEQHDYLFSIASYERENTIDFGVLESQDGLLLSGFQEKPTHTYMVSMGVYMVNRQVLDYIPAGKAYGFDQLMHQLLRQKQYPIIYPYAGYWLDIGRPDDYFKACDEFEGMQSIFLPPLK